MQLRTPKQALSHPQCCWSDDGSASIQASKHKRETACNTFKTTNLSDPEDACKKVTFCLVFLLFYSNLCDLCGM